MNRNLVAALAAAAVCAATAAAADEGMWTFDNFPSDKVKAKYGVDINLKWLDTVRFASVRLSSGCSASIVTKDGLVLTNHHCVRDCAQNLSTDKTDYVKDGFAAAKQEDEKLCPGMQAEVLGGIYDVTPRVTAAAQGKTGQDFVKARDAEIAAVEKEGCAGKESLYRCQVVTLYQGGQYKLYMFRKYSDVRLVFAPEQQMAFFGGDPDNFNFPRYDLDCSFVRLYENGKPVSTPDHLKWRVDPPKEGEPVFVSGNPGTTQRLLTAEQLETIRDVSQPDTLLLLAELRGRLIRFGEESAENARISNEDLFSVENAFKAYRGQQEALVDPALIAAKHQSDAALRAKVMKDKSLAAEIGDPWAETAKVQADRRALYEPYTYMESRAGILSSLFGYGRALVRAAQERPKPNGERLPEYTDSRLPLLEKRVLDNEPVYPGLEELKLEFWLTKLREHLTADSEGTKTFLGKESPEALAARLSKSKLADAAYRKQLWDGGLAAIENSDDPMIRFVLATDAASRAIRKEYETRVTGPSDRAAEKIARARFAVYGTSTYPDATFSPRISYGRVEGWVENGTPVKPFTYLGGLWDRATGQDPFALAPRWVNARDRIDPGVVFNFTTNNDIVGGNSGSPVIDASAHVIGAAFDGNIHSLGGNFGFDDSQNRCVVVSTAAITEALSKIYNQPALVADLMGQ
ncbi:MAG TPA: S46 family peptidase [Rhizomicrobium sp.]|nr:S46 family peptidase [Rhizomicrobium sp.]